MKGLIGRQTKYHSLFYGLNGYNKKDMEIFSREDIISFRIQVLSFHSLHRTRAIKYPKTP